MSQNQIFSWLEKQNPPPTLEQTLEQFPKLTSTVKHHWTIWMKDNHPDELKKMKQEEKQKTATSDEAYKRVSKYMYDNQSADLEEIKEALPDIDKKVVEESFKKLAKFRSKKARGDEVRSMIEKDLNIGFETILQIFPDYNPSTFRSDVRRVKQKLEKLEKEGKLKTKDESQSEEVEEVEEAKGDLPDDDPGVLGILNGLEDIDEEDLEDIENDEEDQTEEKQQDSEKPDQIPSKNATESEETLKNATETKSEPEETDQVLDTINQLNNLVKTLRGMKNRPSIDIELNIKLKI